MKNYVGQSPCKTFWNVDSADDELHESWLNSSEDCWKSNFEVEQGKNFPSPIYWLLIWAHIPFPNILKWENLSIFPWMEVLISSYMEHFKDWMGLLSYKSTFSFAPPIKEKHISLCESHIYFNRSRVYIMTGTRYRFGCHNLLQTRKRSQNLHTAYGFTHQRQMWNIENISDLYPNWKLYFCWNYQNQIGIRSTTSYLRPSCAIVWKIYSQLSRTSSQKKIESL